MFLETGSLLGCPALQREEAGATPICPGGTCSWMGPANSIATDVVACLLRGCFNRAATCTLLQQGPQANPSGPLFPRGHPHIMPGPASYKPKLQCRFFRQGRCNRGADCRYAHSDSVTIPCKSFKEGSGGTSRRQPLPDAKVLPIGPKAEPARPASGPRVGREKRQRRQGESPRRTRNFTSWSRSSTSRSNSSNGSGRRHHGRLGIPPPPSPTPTQRRCDCGAGPSCGCRGGRSPSSYSYTSRSTWSDSGRRQSRPVRRSSSCQGSAKRRDERSHSLRDGHAVRGPAGDTVMARPRSHTPPVKEEAVTAEAKLETTASIKASEHKQHNQKRQALKGKQLKRQDMQKGRLDLQDDDQQQQEQQRPQTQRPKEKRQLEQKDSNSRRGKPKQQLEETQRKQAKCDQTSAGAASSPWSRSAERNAAAAPPPVLSLTRPNTAPSAVPEGGPVVVMLFGSSSALMSGEGFAHGAQALARMMNLAGGW
jgi:hypothetical protein